MTKSFMDWKKQFKLYKEGVGGIPRYRIPFGETQLSTVMVCIYGL